MTTLATSPLSIGAALSQLFVGEPARTPAAEPAPSIDVAVHLAREIGRLGTIQESMGGFRIKTDKPLAFPFGQVLSALLSRSFKVTVAQWDATLVIEARP